MPNYDYRCPDCRKRVSIYQTYAEYGTVAPVCPNCGGTNLNRLIGRVRVMRCPAEYRDGGYLPQQWNYGMTGGQAAPTTPMGLKTATTPYGTFENPFDISELVIAAGATFVARWTTHHARQLTASIKKAIPKKGFSFIEVITQCPVQYGRKTGSGSAVQMMKEYKEKSIPVKEAAKVSKDELHGRIVVRELVDREAPEMLDEVNKMKRKVSGEKA